MKIQPPSLLAIQKARKDLGNEIYTTPVWECRRDQLSIWLKLELWQLGGSFKIRAAMLAIKALSIEQKNRGVVAISAGNHAIAVAQAARHFGIHAKVLMPESASPVRIEKCRTLGAEVLLLKDMNEVFEQGEAIQKKEGRVLLHPFDGETVALGTGTLGLELYHQVGQLDALLMGVGGGGLIGGVANAYKQLQPSIKMIGVEPEGSAVMNQSLKLGHPTHCVPKSIADSLCAPKTELYPFTLCQQFVDQMVLVSEDQIVEGMRFLFNEMKLAVEPACAVGIAAVIGPLKEELKNKRIGIVLSGTNIDSQRFCRLINE